MSKQQPNIFGQVPRRYRRLNGVLTSSERRTTSNQKLAQWGVDVSLEISCFFASKALKAFVRVFKSTSTNLIS